MAHYSGRSHIDIVCDEKLKNMSEKERKCLDETSKTMQKCGEEILESLKPQIIETWSDGKNVCTMYQKYTEGGMLHQWVERKPLYNPFNTTIFVVF